MLKKDEMQKLDKILWNNSLRKNFSMNFPHYRLKDHDISQFLQIPRILFIVHGQFEKSSLTFRVCWYICCKFVHFKEKHVKNQDFCEQLLERTAARVKWCRFAKTWIPWQQWLVWIIWVKEEKIELFEILLSRKFLDA